MNALWISRMCAYKHSPEALESAKNIIGKKIERESAFLRRNHKAAFIPNFSTAAHLKDLLLVEARAAHHFWRAYKDLLPEWTLFAGRVQRGNDVVNRLLDVGYHHLTTIVRTYLKERDVPTSLALLHVPRESTSDPLVYDLVELFRADIVDTELLRFMNLKKEPISEVDSEIPHFLHELNERLAHLHYLASFCQCHTYRYYMELQMLAFIYAVNHKKRFVPIRIPDRHDSRCLTPVTPMLE